jgi:hypothetical protein
MADPPSDVARTEQPPHAATEAAARRTRREIRKLETPVLEATEARRFALRAIGAVGAVLILVTGSGVLVDPHAQFGSPLGYEPLIPDIIELKLGRYQDLPAKPDTVFLGSSKAALLPPAAWNGTAFNFAISGPTMADLRDVATFVARDASPRAIVVELDILDLEEGKEDQLPSSAAHERLTGRPRPFGDVVADLAATWDPVHWQDSGRVLWFDHVAGYPPALLDIAPDGLATQPFLDGERRLNDGAIAARAAAGYSSFLPGGHRDTGFTMDEDQVRHIAGLVGDARAAGIEVYLFIPPRHMAAYEILEGSTRAMQAFDELRAIALGLCEDGVHFHDLLHPGHAALEGKDFYDGHHTTVEGGQKILEALRDPGLDRCESLPEAMPAAQASPG